MNATKGLLPTTSIFNLIDETLVLDEVNGKKKAPLKDAFNY